MVLMILPLGEEREEESLYRILVCYDRKKMREYCKVNSEYLQVKDMPQPNEKVAKAAVASAAGAKPGKIAVTFLRVPLSVINNMLRGK